jgi:hypothetical protein
MNLVRVGGYCLAKPRTSLDFRLSVVADLCFNHNGPAIRLFDKNIWTAAFFKDPPYVFRVDSPCAPKGHSKPLQVMY